MEKTSINLALLMLKQLGSSCNYLMAFSLLKVRRGSWVSSSDVQKQDAPIGRKIFDSQVRSALGIGGLMCKYIRGLAASRESSAATELMQGIAQRIVRRSTIMEARHQMMAK